MGGRYFVYILASKRNGTLYIGVTNALARRIYQHKEGRGSVFTRKYQVHRLVYAEEFSDVTQAIQRETNLKHWPRRWKIELIEKLDCPNLSVHKLDATNRAELEHFLKSQKVEAVISCLPYYCNFTVAEMALKFGLHYFDLTEDVEVARHIEKISSGAETAFVPQCGLAPGFISIIANELMTRFEELDTVKLRVGALPINPSSTARLMLIRSAKALTPPSPANSAKPITAEAPPSARSCIPKDSFSHTPKTPFTS